MERKTVTTFLVGVALVSGIALLSGCATTNNSTANADAVQVAVSTSIIQEMVETIGGEPIEISVAPGVGISSHDYEPTAKDVATILESDLFVYNGAGLEAWSESVAEQIHDDEAETTVVELAETVEDHLLTSDGDEHADEHEDEDDHDHDHGEFDPHIWLDPLLYIEQVEAVRDALVEVGPEHRSTFEENATEYIERIESVHDAYTTGLANCTADSIIVSHNAYSYLANRYNFTIHPISGLSPDAEPSLQQLAELTDLAEEEGIGYVFYEELVSPKIAETLAAEIGAETLVLSPIEGIQTDSDSHYITLMTQNLENLQTAMQCQ